MFSVGAVAVCTAALIIFLSVLNGFDGLIESLFNSFEPDLKITAIKGKVFSYDEYPNLLKLKDIDGVEYISENVEENALCRYGERQNMVVVKGVDDQFTKISGVDTMMIKGDFILQHENRPYAVLGAGVSYFLGVGLEFVNPLVLFTPKKDVKNFNNPMQALSRKFIYPSGVFGIQADFDSKYMIVPIDFARELLDYTDEISALEIKVKSGANVDRIQNEIIDLIGESHKVQNRYQLHEATYKIMKSEKFMIFLILTFILIIASFNIIGSVTMLIFEKKSDISTLRSMGANLVSIRKIFLFEGWMITIVGTVFGLILGGLVCWVQIQFGIVRLGAQGAMIIDAYPVIVKSIDLLIVIFSICPHLLTSFMLRTFQHRRDNRQALYISLNL